MIEVIEQAVVQAAASVIKKEATAIGSAVPLSQQGFDELDMFELLLKIEDTFMLEISDTDAEQLVTVERIVAYVAARKADEKTT